MARRIYEFQVATPAGSLQSAPLVTALTMPPGEVLRVEVKVPPGPRGALGFGFGQAGQIVIPEGEGQFIVTDNEEIGWDLEGQVDSGAWQCISYNSGVFAHSIRVRFLLNLPGPLGPAVAQPLDLSALGVP